MEYLIIAIALVIAFFAIGYFIEIGLNIIFSVIILVCAALVLFSDFGGALLSDGTGALMTYPFNAASVIASGVALLLVWLVSGKTQWIVIGIWAVLQLPSYNTITDNAGEVLRTFGIIEAAEEITE